MNQRRIRLTAVAVGVGALAAGCGGTGTSGNGVAAKSASAILAAAKAAGSGASSVKVTASADTGGVQESYVLTEEDPSHYEESLAVVNGQRFTRLRIGSDLFVIGNGAFLATQNATAAQQKSLNDQWLGGTTAAASTLPRLTQLMDTTLTPSGALTKGPTSTLDGQPVVAVIDSAVGGTLYVATTGTPYPVEVAKSSTSGTSTITFSDWNKPVTLNPPTSYKSLSELP